MGKYAKCITELSMLINSDLELSAILKSFYKKPRKKVSVSKLLEVIIKVLKHPEARKYFIYALRIIQEAEKTRSIENNVAALIQKRPKIFILKFEVQRQNFLRS